MEQIALPIGNLLQIGTASRSRWRLRRDRRRDSRQGPGRWYGERKWQDRKRHWQSVQEALLISSNLLDRASRGAENSLMKIDQFCGRDLQWLVICPTRHRCTIAEGRFVRTDSIGNGVV
jgi:hypothetical protein